MISDSGLLFWATL